MRKTYFAFILLIMFFIRYAEGSTVMRILNIIDPVDAEILRERSIPVFESDPDLKNDIKMLVETLENTPNSAGLSAIQIGIRKRVVVIDWPNASETVPNVKFPLVMINPKIIWHSYETVEDFEGCLSVPYDYTKLVSKDDYFIERYSKVKVRYFDEYFNEKIIESGIQNQFFTRCLQHEIDHLDGILYIDHLSEEKRNDIIRLNKEYNKK